MHRSLSAKSSDPLAVDDEEPLDGEDGPKAAQWEHEDLAQVRVKVFRGQLCIFVFQKGRIELN